MLRAILNESWRQHPTKEQLCGHLPPITKTIKVRRTRHEGHCSRSKDELISDIPLWTPSMDEQRPDDQLEPINNSSVPIHDVALNTSREQWMIETGGERGPGRSVLIARHDDDYDIFFFFFRNARGVMVIVVGNGHGDTSSNPGQD